MNFDAINDKVYAVEEGATKEAIKVIKSKEMKEASVYIKKGMALRRGIIRKLRYPNSKRRRKSIRSFRMTFAKSRLALFPLSLDQL